MEEYRETHSRKKVSGSFPLLTRRRLLFAAAAVVLVLAAVLLLRAGGRGQRGSSDYGLPDYVTEDYIRINKYSRPRIALAQVNDIVIHYVGNPGTSAGNNRDYFDNLSRQSGDDGTYASSNFIVGLEGEVIACVPIDEIAYASNNRNSDSLSIEVCHPDETGQFSEATYASLVRLTVWLCHRYGLSADHVIRHYDVTGKLCPLYYVEHEDAWLAFRKDVQAGLDQLAAEESRSS